MWLKFLSALLGCGVCSVWAMDYQVRLLDNQGAAVEEAVVYLKPKFDVPIGAIPIAQMSQMNKQFDPHILVVQKGSQVSFPNRDDIRHHVFSFSPTKTFELELYKGEAHQPQVFAQVGNVELGCNVHDWMLGYIKVVDTPFFAKTDAEGKAKLSELPAGDYRLVVWHPRILNAFQGLQQDIAISASATLEIQLEDAMSEPLHGFDVFDESAAYQ